MPLTGGREEGGWSPADKRKIQIQVVPADANPNGVRGKHKDDERVHTKLICEQGNHWGAGTTKLACGPSMADFWVLAI